VIRHKWVGLHFQSLNDTLRLALKILISMKTNRLSTGLPEGMECGGSISRVPAKHVFHKVEGILTCSWNELMEWGSVKCWVFKIHMPRELMSFWPFSLENKPGVIIPPG